MALKCMICKEPGKKNAMKACLDCKGFSHTSCLQQEGEQTIRHICRKCRHKRHERLGLKKLERANGDDKSTAKKFEKEKKREEHMKKMNEFQ